MFSRHIDGHHKLKCWRIVIHGAVDGYSRRIAYLPCNNNSLAATVLHLLIAAISIRGLPSRVRAGFGVKNVDVTRFMVDCPECGINRVSFIVGISVHNQCMCIECVWGEVIRSVVRHFHNIVFFLENKGFLDLLDEAHTLHYIYMSRIKKGP